VVCAGVSGQGEGGVGDLFHPLAGCFYEFSSYGFVINA
jgi:hypothetical protein